MGYPVSEQGAHDGLCGVYSAINATAHLGNGAVRKKHRDEIFKELIELLDEQGRLANVIINGMGVRTLGRLLDKVSQYSQREFGFEIKRKLAYKAAAPSLSDFWTKIADHVNQHGAASVLLCLMGKYEHWTCVESVSGSRICLIDSDKLRILPRIRVTVASSFAKRHHELWSTQTYLLSTH